MKWTTITYKEGSGQPVMFSKNLIRLPGGRKIDIHKMVSADNEGCFHSHPANAIRLILWGGYEEEIYSDTPQYKRLKFLQFGLVRSTFTHRIHRLLNGHSSWSLWFRGKTVDKIYLRGNGWPSRLKDKAV
jgi:hypothetical protein